MREIIDNFLPNQVFEAIRDLLLGDDFPWFYSSSVASRSDHNSDFYFLHNFLDKDENESYMSKHIKVLFDYLQETDDIDILRVRANCYVNQGRQVKHQYHVDRPGAEGNLVGMLSINTCNGYTEFEDGFAIHSVANRLALFNDHPHRSVSQSDTKTRVNINFNYMRV